MSPIYRRRPAYVLVKRHPQPLLARLLEGCAVSALDERSRGRSDICSPVHNPPTSIDASVVVGAAPRGDSIATSDRHDIAILANAVGRQVNVIRV
jgi:hypothetical protein